MFPFAYRRQTVQAQPTPRRVTQNGSGGGRAVPSMEDGGVLIGRRVVGGQAVGRQAGG